MKIRDYNAAKRLAVKARNSIGQYCMEECSSLCCREGTITITDNELKLMSRDRIIIPGSITTFIKNQNKLNLKVGCPSFIDNKCAIHFNRGRPKMCKDFPLFIYGDKIVVAHDCSAVDAGKLFPYLHKFKKMGFKLI
jgi:Fe-S-cluster containining protein